MPTIQLWLLRHGHAGDPGRWTGADAERPLSAKGREQAERLAALLAASGVPIEAVLTSPRVRAHQTAVPIAARLGLAVQLEPRLAGAVTVAELESMIVDAGNPASLLVVGHDPDVSNLLGELTGLAWPAMRKGALARVDADRPIGTGRGILRWLVPPDAVPG